MITKALNNRHKNKFKEAYTALRSPVFRLFPSVFGLRSPVSGLPTFPFRLRPPVFGLPHLLTIVSISFLLCTPLKAQSPLTASGYTSAMPILYWNDSSTYKQAVLHNRLNFNWYPSDKITGSVQFWNQILVGDFVEMGTHENGFQEDGYFLPLTFKQTVGDKGLAYLSVDRLWVQYTHNNLEVKAGRQRINWSQTFAWNPNDIFNTYNYFDFDYVERPGADAIRIQYYPNYTSSIDVAVKVDSSNNVTFAARYLLNKWGFDFQFITGYYSQPTTKFPAGTDEVDKDFISGFGFTTDVKGISLRGEATYLEPLEKSANQQSLFLSTIGLDYTLPFDLYASAEYFYASEVYLPMSTGGLISTFNTPMTIKSLAYATHNAFAQFSYPATPLLTLAASGMYFKDETLEGFYFGPNCDYSLTDNLEASLFFQFFNFEVDGMDQARQANFGYARVKWSF